MFQQSKYPYTISLLVLSLSFSMSLEAQAQSTAGLDHQEQQSIGALTFSVVNIQRPLTRSGKTLVSPRHIYLLASREPSTQEARRLAASEKRALKRRAKRRRRKSRASLVSGPRPWEGRLLKTFRLGPPRPRIYPTPAHLKYFEQMRAYEKDLLEKRNQKLTTLSAKGSPIALSTPAAPVELLEESDDDDELSGAEDGEICGHEGEACCQTTRRGSCDSGLMCVDSRCIPPPPPCGGFEQACCDKAPACRRSALYCLISDTSSDRACLFPPPKPERIKTPIGILEIIEVEGRLIKATVRYDALQSRKNNQPLNAIRQGDKAVWY